MSDAKKRSDQSVSQGMGMQSRADVLLDDRPFPLAVLTACVAHDLSSPLTYIRWDVDALTRLVEALDRLGERLIGGDRWAAGRTEDPKLERMLREYPTILEHIHNGLDRLQLLSKDLAALARDEPTAVPYDICAAVVSAMRVIRPYVARRLIVEMRIEEAPLLVRGSATDMTLALMNLGINAAQATGGSLGQGRLEVAVAGTHDEVVVRFADTGPGLSITPPERAFEPFVAGDPGRSGLGLALVQQVVAAHGGAASLESRPDGTTVTLRLPRELPSR